MAILNSGDKKRFFEILGRKNITYKGSGIRIALDFSTAASLKILKVRDIQSTIIYVDKLLIMMEGKIEIFSDIQSLKNLLESTLQNRKKINQE